MNHYILQPPATTDEMCYKMYCFDPGRKMCITGSEQRAAMGTSCGDKKVREKEICGYNITEIKIKTNMQSHLMICFDFVVV